MNRETSKGYTCYKRLCKGCIEIHFNRAVWLRHQNICRCTRIKSLRWNSSPRNNIGASKGICHMILAFLKVTIIWVTLITSYENTSWLPNLQNLSLKSRSIPRTYNLRNILHSSTFLEPSKLSSFKSKINKLDHVSPLLLESSLSSFFWGSATGHRGHFPTRQTTSTHQTSLSCEINLKNLT